VFFDNIDVLGGCKNGNFNCRLRGGKIKIVVDHACMNKLKEKKPKDFDATESQKCHLALDIG